jgi:hypothetical protein
MKWVGGRADHRFDGVQRAARSFCAGFGVVGNLFHRDGELFDSARGVSDFLILLRRASLHFVGGHQNVVGAGSNFHGRFANALQHLSEVVEHVVDGIGDVTKRIVGHFSAQGQFAARHLIDHRKKFSDAALQIFAGFLIGVGLGHFGDGAVQVFRNVAELIVGLQVNARACIPGGDPLGEFRHLLHRRDDGAAEAPGEKAADRQRQQCGRSRRAAPLGSDVKSSSDLSLNRPAHGIPARLQRRAPAHSKASVRRLNSIAISLLPPKLLLPGVVTTLQHHANSMQNL